jgi:hypothetical protein
MKKVNVCITEWYQVEVPDDVDVNTLMATDWDSLNITLEDEGFKAEYSGKCRDTLEVVIEED